jgi:hypothetical protein
MPDLMKVIYHEPRDPELFEAVCTAYAQHQDFFTVRDNDNGRSFFNRKLNICVVIDHPYSVCNLTPP